MANSLIEELLAAYNDLMRFLARRLGNADDAADVAQSSFERVYAHSLAETITSPRALLFRTAQNLLIDLHRGERRRGKHATLDEATDFVVDLRPLPEQELAMRQQLAILQTALEELPPNCSAALLLNRIEGLSHAEIAEKLGVSASMVSKYIMQALRQCIRRLGMPHR